MADKESYGLTQRLRLQQPQVGLQGQVELPRHLLCSQFEGQGRCIRFQPCSSSCDEQIQLQVGRSTVSDGSINSLRAFLARKC